MAVHFTVLSADNISVIGFFRELRALDMSVLLPANTLYAQSPARTLGFVRKNIDTIALPLGTDPGSEKRTGSQEPCLNKPFSFRCSFLCLGIKISSWIEFILTPIQEDIYLACGVYTEFVILC